MELINIKRIKDSKRYKLDSFFRLNILDTENGWLAGGAVRSLIDNSNIQDYDLFFKNEESLNYTKSKLQELKADKIFECPLGYLTTYKYGDLKIQLISKRFYHSLEVLFNSFDFTCCQFSATRTKFITTKTALKDTIKKELHLNELEYPVATINRIRKYKSKGYKIDNCIKDVVLTLLNRNLSNYPENTMVFYID